MAHDAVSGNRCRGRQKTRGKYARNRDMENVGLTVEGGITKDKVEDINPKQFRRSQMMGKA